MKLALSSQRGVEILTVSGEVAEPDTQVLRAGLTKILKTGKNKIILEMPSNQELPSEVIRAIAGFDLVARELSGRIVLSAVSAALKMQLGIFAKPPVILCFGTREQALEFLAAPPKPEIVESPLPGPAPEDELKGRLQELELENSRLKEQVVEAVIARRAPPDEAAYLKTIQFLEAKIEKLLAEISGANAEKT